MNNWVKNNSAKYHFHIKPHEIGISQGSYGNLAGFCDHSGQIGYVPFCLCQLETNYRQLFGIIDHSERILRDSQPLDIGYNGLHEQN
jgi:hypothetical protein